MPLLKKKVYDLAPYPGDLKPSEELFVISETRECFRSYDEYIEKVFLYGSQVWSCQYSGHSGLTYKEAMNSEKAVLKQLKSFPECFKKPLLQVIHQGQGRLDAVLESCSQLIKHEYFPQEEVYICDNKSGKKNPGVVVEVTKPGGERLQVDLVLPDKENKTAKTPTKKVAYRYNILTGSEIIQTNVSSDDIRRNVQIPSKQLLKLFVKSSAGKFNVKGKDIWLVKDELIKKYNLPAVPKTMQELLQAKDPSRGPLCTIHGPNDESVRKNKLKNSLKVSPRSNDPTQRTLNSFIQDLKKDIKTVSHTKHKDNIKKAMSESSFGPEVEICLIPVSIQRSLAERSGLKKIDKSVKLKEATVANDDSTSRSENISNSGGKQDKMQSSKFPEDRSVAILAKRKESRKRQEGKENEKISSKDLVSVAQDVPDIMVDGNQDDEVCIVDRDLCEKEREIVKKNTLKKQKTLSEMFKLNVLKKPIPLEGSQQKKVSPVGEHGNISSPLPLQRPTLIVQDKQQILKENEIKERKLKELQLKKTFKAKSETEKLKEESELVLAPLPSPKAVSVAEELSQSYGDILMVTQFIHTFDDFINQDAELKLTPDELATALVSSPQGHDCYLCILIVFLTILLKNSRQDDTSEKFLELDVDLFDVPLTKETVGELTRLYLRKDQEDNSSSIGRQKTIPRKQLPSLSPNILKDLDEEEILDLLPSEKLEILVYLLQRVLDSDVFCDHLDDIVEKRKQTWHQLSKERNDLKQEQKNKEFVKNKQKEIDMFMVKDETIDIGKGENIDVSESVRGAQEGDQFKNGHCEENNSNNVLFEMSSKGMEKPRSADSGSGDLTHAKEVDNVEKNKSADITINNEEKKADCTYLTKRQELVAKNKIEKEKEGEIRRLNEELYQREQKVERLKKGLVKAKCTFRVNSLGRDRNHSRYWLFPCCPTRLYVEKIVAGKVFPIATSIEETERNETSEVMLERNERSSWFYYDSKEEMDNLLKALSPRGVRESALTYTLKSQHSKIKHNFSKRPVNNKKSTAKNNLSDFLASLKEELTELGRRITNGFMGDLPNLESWLENVNNCSSTPHLVSYAVELGSSVKAKGLSERLKNPERWLREKWIPAVKRARTLSSLHFCLCVLDCCLKWEECTLYLKCKICRSNGNAMISCDKCHKGYHFTCLREVLEVPVEQWLCPGCKPSFSKRRAESLDYITEQNECIEVEEQVNEDYCDVCGGDDGELVCCDTCPKVYHKQCHDPPMRNVPRGIWNCCNCQKETETRPKKRYYIEEDSSDWSNSTDSSVEEVSIPRKRTTQQKIESTGENGIMKQKRPARKDAKVGRKRKCTPLKADKGIEEGVKRKPRQDSELGKCEAMLTELFKHEDSWPFTEPVDLYQVPDYLEIVTHPIDLGTIKKKLNGLEYSGHHDFLNDIQLMFSNCNKYNVDTSEHGQAGISLGTYFKEILPTYFPDYSAFSVMGRRKCSRRCRKK